VVSIVPSISVVPVVSDIPDVSFAVFVAVSVVLVCSEFLWLCWFSSKILNLLSWFLLVHVVVSISIVSSVSIVSHVSNVSVSSVAIIVKLGASFLDWFSSSFLNLLGWFLLGHVVVSVSIVPTVPVVSDIPDVSFTVFVAVSVVLISSEFLWLKLIFFSSVLY